MDHVFDYCIGCKNCPYRSDDECKDALCYGYCPLNEEDDIGSPTVREMRL